MSTGRNLRGSGGTKNNIAVPENEPMPFVIVDVGKSAKVNHTFYLSNSTAQLQEPKARIALVFIEEGCNTIELDNGEKHVGILGTWPKSPLSQEITHKFTCLDDFAPEGHSVFMRAVTRNAE